jgi:hypothetical protein
VSDLLDHLRVLEAELHHPGSARSRERLEQLLHPRFHEVGKSGRRYTREGVIAHLSSLAERPDVVADEYAVHVLVDGCALLTYRSSEPAPEGGGRVVALRSSIWLRTPAGWQLYHHQGTPCPASV